MSWPKHQVSMQSKTEGLGPVPLDYVGKHKAITSKTIAVDLIWQEKRQFAFMVNEQVFNPMESIAAHKLVDLVLSEKIKVADKSVIDLGCGSGVVGLSTIVKKAEKVLFTDINPHIEGIQKHPLFRKCDEWQVQSILANVPDGSYDMVLVLPPAMVAQEGHHIALDTFESGIFRPSSFYVQVIDDAGRVLKPGGQLVIWLRIPLGSIDSFIELINVASEVFDMRATNMLADGIESVICFDHEKSMMARWTYKFQKGGVSNDALWMMLSLTRKNENTSKERAD